MLLFLLKFILQRGIVFLLSHLKVGYEILAFSLKVFYCFFGDVKKELEKICNLLRYQEYADYVNQKR